MRILILPLVIVLLCCSVAAYSQQGISCTTPYVLPTLTATCTNTPIDISPAAFATGPHKLSCSPNYPDNPAGGKVVYLAFHPNSATSCVKISLSTNATNVVRMEAALYTGGCVTPPDPNTISTSNSMCFKDGSGVWTKTSTGGNWPSWSGSAIYYLRVYIPDAIVTIAPGVIPPQLNICATEATPANDACSSAVRIDGTLIGSDNVCATGGASEPINGGIPDPNGPTKPNPAPSWVCAGVLQNTVWYYYTVQTTGPSSLNINSTNCDFFSSNTNAYMQIGLMVGGCTPATILPAGPAPGYSIVCTTVGPGAPSGNTTSATLNAPSLPAGTTILVGMDGYLNANCSYNFNITNAIPIPIKLRYFGAWAEGSYNHTKWITSFEHNNAYFEIQRSLDGNNFESIGRIAGNENSSDDITYTFDDKYPPAIGYYRLAQFDLDGQSSYSDIVRVVRKDNSDYFDASLVNPVHNTSLVNVKTGKEGVVNMQIVDVAGRVLSAQIVPCIKGNNPMYKDFSKLLPGTYYLVVMQGSNRIVKPFIKQ